MVTTVTIGYRSYRGYLGYHCYTISKYLELSVQEVYLWLFEGGYPFDTSHYTLLILVLYRLNNLLWEYW